MNAPEQLRVDPLISITAIPSGHIANVMDKILPHIVRVAERTNGRSCADDILKELLTGESTIWLAFAPEEENKVYGVLICKVLQYPRIKALNIYYVVGTRFSIWQDDMQNTMDRWARDCQCNIIEFTGRAGWAKVLKAWGAVETYRVYEKGV